ncbi:MAG: glycosyltransferase family A protein [Anaerolineales bacterium]|jgi:glycosyltransferase involved in cell wall biosynthesis
MRAGQNPAKFLEGQPEKLHRVTAALLTYIPSLQGYYAESLEVLKLCLASLRENSDLGFDLLVFDNASGKETREYLQSLHSEGQIDFLLLSDRNLGKGKAWDIIFGAAPGEVIAYADSDVYFEQGWLKNALQILETFPRVGMVTCRPMRTYEEGHTATLEWAQVDPQAELELGKFMDWETFREHDVSLGQEEQQVRARYENTQDALITYRSVKALAGAAHWQFVAYKEVLQRFLPLGIERMLGDDRKLDDALNQDGYLRLMTTTPFIRHLGNTVPKDPGDVSSFSDVNARKVEGSIGRRLLDFPPLRRVLLGIYNRIFHWYFHR